MVLLLKLIKAAILFGSTLNGRYRVLVLLPITASKKKKDSHKNKNDKLNDEYHMNL